MGLLYTIDLPKVLLIDGKFKVSKARVENSITILRFPFEISHIAETAYDDVRACHVLESEFPITPLLVTWLNLQRIDRGFGYVLGKSQLGKFSPKMKTLLQYLDFRNHDGHRFEPVASSSSFVILFYRSMYFREHGKSVKLLHWYF